jgi:hypothetical protein
MAHSFVSYLLVTFKNKRALPSTCAKPPFCQEKTEEEKKENCKEVLQGQTFI